MNTELSDDDCRCCCCTGECRELDDYDDPLFAGFVEGDYDEADPT